MKEKSKNYPEWSKVNVDDDFCYINDPIKDQQVMGILKTWCEKNNLNYIGRTESYPLAIKITPLYNNNSKVNLRKHLAFFELFSE